MGEPRGEDPGARKDAALTFVVDVSGSMAEPNKLDLVQDALHTLINQLHPTDQVAIVAYDDTARVLREMTPVRDQESLHAAGVEGLRKVVAFSSADAADGDDQIAGFHSAANSLDGRRTLIGQMVRSDRLRAESPQKVRRHHAV